MSAFSWQHLNWVDYAIFGVIAFSTLVSLIRGFVREAISLATWFLAVWVAYHYASFVAGYFVDYIKTPAVRNSVVFMGIFFAMLIVGAIINYIIGNLVAKTGLSGTDRIIGLAFGCARGILFVAVLILMGTMNNNIPNQTWWKQSQMIPEFAGIVDWLKKMLPTELNQMNLNMGKDVTFIGDQH